MPKKEDTPLQSLQKETDALQKNVNAFDKEVNAFLKKKTEDREKSRLFYTSSQEHMCTVEELLRKLENLNPEDESMKLSKFESKKKDETKKINNTKEKLSKISTRFEPDEVEEGKVQEEGIEAEDSEEDDEDEEDEEDEDDEDEDDEEEEEDSTVMDTMEIEKERAAAIKKGKDAGVKSKKADVKTEPKREVVDMPKAGSSKQSAANIEEESEEEDDEEDEEEDEDDEDEESEGDVSGEDDDEDEEEEDDDEEESDDEEDEDEEEVATGTGMFITLEDFEAEQKDDLAFKQGEVLTVISSRPDGWCEARNAQGHQGMVPCTYLQVYKDEEQDDDDENEDEEDEDSEVQSPTTPRSGRNLWKNIKSAVRETSATDVLHALGAMPSGFRDSSLAKMKKQDQYSMKNILAPKLSPSCVSYRDVFQSEDTDLIRPRTVKIQRIITLVQARQIPLPGTGVEVKSRHVRVCLFDGQNIVSNIHTIGISGLDKDQRTWNFNNKMEVKKSFNFGEIFIRSNSNDSDIGILFELCVSFLRTSTGQEGELSCGWTHLKLFDAEGKPIQNKTFDEPVQGGTIYDRGVELDPSVGKKASQIQNLGTTTNMFRSLVASNKQPRLVIRIVDPTKDQKTYLDTLPDVVLSSTTYISYLSFYRQVLCDVLLRDRIDPQSTELVHSPLLTTFPEVIEQPDLMDVLRTVWADKMKVTKRAEKKDLVTLKDRFRQVYLENIYPLFGCASLPPYKVGNPQIEEERFTEITRQVNMNKIGLVKSLLSADVKHRPFDISELAFDVMGPYCMTKAHGV